MSKREIWWINPQNEGNDLIADPEELETVRKVIKHNFPQSRQDNIEIRVRKYSEK